MRLILLCSVDGFRALVERHLEVEVTGFDRNGQAITVDASGWQARIFQHECDHLEGMLYVDKMVPRTFRTVENLDLPLAVGCPKLGARQHSWHKKNLSRLVADTIFCTMHCGPFFSWEKTNAEYVRLCSWLFCYRAWIALTKKVDVAQAIPHLNNSFMSPDRLHCDSTDTVSWMISRRNTFALMSMTMCRYGSSQYCCRSGKDMLQEPAM